MVTEKMGGGGEAGLLEEGDRQSVLAVSPILCARPTSRAQTTSREHHSQMDWAKSKNA